MGLELPLLLHGTGMVSLSLRSSMRRSKNRPRYGARQELRRGSGCESIDESKNGHRLCLRFQHLRAKAGFDERGLNR